MLPPRIRLIAATSPPAEVTATSPLGRLLLVPLAAAAMTCGDATGGGGGPPAATSAPTAASEGPVGGDREGILPRDPLTACWAQGVPAVRQAATTTRDYLAARDRGAGSGEVARLRQMSLGHANAAALAFGRCARDLEDRGNRDGGEQRASAAARRVAERAQALARAVDEDGDVATALDAMTRALDEWAATGDTEQKGPRPAPQPTSDP